MEEKLCVFCKHFYLDMGHPDQSSVTPGENARIECEKGHWEMKNYEGTDVYRFNILKAVSCDDFEEFSP